MFIEQLFASQDSCASYFIESDGVAAVIDPDRSVRKYIQLANNREAVIKFIFLTHFQTDFLGGHLELAESTGAPIITGPCEGSGFQNECISDGHTFSLGSMTIRAIHTPGHTPEACCYLLYDETMNPHSLFTGDTLLAGDVGRTDLILPGGSTAADMAGRLYDSLFDKIIALPGYLNLFPGNGFASSFMKLSGRSTYSTLGQEKYSNHALKPRSRDEFVEIFSRPEHEPLHYFERLYNGNRQKVDGFEKVLEASLKEIGVEQFAGLARPGQVQILDTRPSQEFCRSFIPGSINIGLDGFFGHIAGMVLAPGTEILLVTEAGREEESVEALARMGFERISGFLEGGFDSWANAGAATDQILNVSPQEFSEQFRFSHSYALDVRDTAEFVPGFVAGAQLIPLHKLETDYKRLDKEKPCYIYCTAGYRSVVAASILKAKGFTKLINVSEGMVGIRNTSILIRQLTAA